ncbi:unnamed protein product, partial [Meganyctiphanes norvegica]
MYCQSSVRSSPSFRERYIPSSPSARERVRERYDPYLPSTREMYIPSLPSVRVRDVPSLPSVSGHFLLRHLFILRHLSERHVPSLPSVRGTFLLCHLSEVYSFILIESYPFSSYGDGFFLLIQTSIIGSLVLHYGGSTQKAFAFIIAIVSITLCLCFGGVPLDLLWTLQAANIPVVFCGKMIQALSNYQNGSTGQLSAITLTMLFAGSMARIFTSVQETGDPIIITTYCVSTFANGVVFAQLLYYWNVSKTKKE